MKTLKEEMPRTSQPSKLAELLARGLIVTFIILCLNYLSKVKVAFNDPAFWEGGLYRTLKGLQDMYWSKRISKSIVQQ